MSDMTQDNAMSDAQAQEAVLGYLLAQEEGPKDDREKQDTETPQTETQVEDAGYSVTLGDDGQPVEKTAVESETEQEGEKAEQEPEEDSDQELRFETIDQVAEAAGMSLEEFLDSVKGTIKVDGEESQVTLKEALAGHQREADYTRKTQEVARQRQEVADRQEKLTQMEQMFQAALMDDPYAVEQQQLAQQYNSVNWAELKENNDGSFADTQVEFQQRHQQLQFLRNQRAQRLQQVQQQMFEQRVELGKQELQKRLPGGLSDVDRQGVAQVLAEVGYSQNELSNLADHRAVLLAREVLESRAAKENVKAAEGKRVKRKTPTLRPGAAQSAVEKADERRKALIGRAHKTQSDEDWADVLVNLGV